MKTTELKSTELSEAVKKFPLPPFFYRCDFHGGIKFGYIEDTDVSDMWYKWVEDMMKEGLINAPNDMNRQTHTKRQALIGAQQVEGYLCNDGTVEILAVMTNIQAMDDSVSATVTPHILTPNGTTLWRRAIVSGDSDEDIIRRYIKAQQKTVRVTVAREDLEGHLLREQGE